MKRRLLALGLSTALTLGGLEVALRAIPDKHFHPFASNPVIAAQANSQVFQFDDELGFKLNPYLRKLQGDSVEPDKTYLIGTQKLQTLDEIASSLDTSRTIILNIGDSSTSGWDSDIVTRNRFNSKNAGNGAGYTPLSPFFQYKTYSDLLAEQGLSVINAGVPAYTSLIGKRYLKNLLEDLRRRNMRIDYVTIYFGNNDGACDGNNQDKYRFPANGFHSEVAHLVETTLLRRFQNIGRVDVDDYSENLQEMIDTCREYGVEPILIRPLIPKYWHPGLRASGQETEVWKVMSGDKGSKVIDDLEKAVYLYEEAERLYKRGSEEQARELFIQAQNLDYMVPRIKPEYVQALQDIARRNSVALIDVQEEIPLDDRRYFKDYCHPTEPANRLITRELLKTIR